MACFTSVMEVEAYRECWCRRCYHLPDDPDDGNCPILALHWCWAGEHGDETKQGLLGIFIPVYEGKNQSCKMFVQVKPSWDELIEQNERRY